MRFTVSRQTARKINRQQSRKVILYRQPSKMQIKINRQNLTILADLHGILASE